MPNIYFKYLASNKSDVDWGLYVKVAGFAENPPGSPYPLTQHPAGYHFSWEKGRVLDEYQVSYITKGSGVLETRKKTHQIAAGTAFIILPGQWHRYRPNPETGWNEHYVGFSGSYADQIFRGPFFRNDLSPFGLGHSIAILSCFQEIIEYVKGEHPGFQQQIAGRVMTILGEIVALMQNQKFEGREIEQRIKEAQFDLRERLDQSLNLESFAQRYEMSYSYFRKLFKTYTGLSPAQYHLQLRLQKARDLLSSTEKSVKEIAFALGFDSQFHFSKIYKKKFGTPPNKSR